MRIGKFWIGKETAPQTDSAMTARSRYTADALQDEVGNYPTDWGTVLPLMKYDPQIKATLLAKKLPLISNGWEVVPAIGHDEEGYEEALNRANHLTYCLEEMAGSVEQLVTDVLAAFEDGWSLCEINWVLLTDGEYAGTVGIGSVKPKRVGFNNNTTGGGISILTDDYLNVTGYQLDDPQHPGEIIPLEADKFIRYSYQPQYGNPYGLSDLRGAYAAYKRKDAVSKWMVVACERYGSPTPLGYYPKGTPKQVQQEVVAALGNVRTDTALLVPEGWTVDKWESSGTAEQIYGAALDYYDRQIARGIIGAELAMQQGSDGRGSYAMAKVHAGMLEQWIMALKRQVEETVIREQLVKRWAIYNYGNTDLLPQFRLGDIEERDLDAYATLIEKLMNVGIMAPEVDGDDIRQKMGFKPGMDDVLKVREENRKRMFEDLAAKKAAVEDKAEFSKVEELLDRIERM